MSPGPGSGEPGHQTTEVRVSPTPRPVPNPARTPPAAWALRKVHGTDGETS